jgi:hypothetical protein
VQQVGRQRADRDPDRPAVLVERHDGERRLSALELGKSGVEAVPDRTRRRVELDDLEASVRCPHAGGRAGGSQDSSGTIDDPDDAVEDGRRRRGLQRRARHANHGRGRPRKRHRGER